MVLCGAMKSAAAKSKPKGRNYTADKSGQAAGAVRDRDGGIVSRGAKGVVQKTLAPVPAGITYDAEDIEEANRIDAALRRQHAR